MNAIKGTPLNVQPVTTAQRAIWTGQAMEPDNSGYNVAVRVDIEGDLNIPLMTQALLDTVCATDAINSFYLQTDNPEFELVQQRHSDVPKQIKIIDLRQSIDAERELSLWMEHDLSRAINLATDSIFCFCLFHHSATKYTLYFRSHHIALDAYALALVLQRIEQSYNASLDPKAKQPHPFAPPHVAVDDEVHYTQSDQYQRDQDFWFASMADLKEVVSFVAKSTLPAPTVFRRDCLIPVDQVHLIERLARHHQTNNAFIVLSAFSAYLSQVTQSRDIVLGLPMMGRISQQALMLPTTLANILPLRVRSNENSSGTELINRVKKQIALIKAHQFYRAETLRQQLKLIGRNRRLVGPTFNIDIFPSTMQLKQCHATIHPLSTGPINDFAVTLKMKKKDGTMPILFMANSRSYDELHCSKYAFGFYHFLSPFLQQIDKEIRRN